MSDRQIIGDFARRAAVGVIAGVIILVGILAVDLIATHLATRPTVDLLVVGGMILGGLALLLAGTRR